TDTRSAVAVADGSRSIRVAQIQAPSSDNSLKSMGTPVAGGGEITLPMSSFQADHHVRVLAIKQHRLTALAGSQIDRAASSTWLSTGLIELVRPNPDQVLSLVRREGRLVLEGGEPGVYYSLLQNNTIVGSEVYFHQQSPTQAQASKGLGALVVGVDLAIPGDFAGTIGQTLPPAVPDTVPAGSLNLRARRAMTGLVATLRTSVTAPSS
ncbi:MAG TPA: hypothetical protein PLA94_32325, partial [Myxococcota bacterium]|nr:hypothetical protein [Myxococcota bacterium]